MHVFYVHLLVLHEWGMHSCNQIHLDTGDAQWKLGWQIDHLLRCVKDWVRNGPSLRYAKKKF